MPHKMHILQDSLVRQKIEQDICDMGVSRADSHQTNAKYGAGRHLLLDIHLQVP